MTVAVVIPSAGRPTLPALVGSLRDLDVILVDDRRDAVAPLLDPVPPHVRVIRGPARGPAAARNAGLRLCRADWVAFLDDDVEPQAGWPDALRRDLDRAAPDVGGVQGRIVVPLPAGRRPTDWERNTHGLETARWATADLAYRRDVLDAVGGFDERFPRAYREDADLGLRVTAAGWRIVMGERVVRHPVRPAPPWVSLAKQAGNADDVLMRRLHGPGWRERAGVPRGRRPRHLATAAAGTLAALLAARGRRRTAALAGTVWLAGTAELAQARIAPGPRTPHEVATMLWTSALLPFAASGAWLGGLARRPAPPCTRPAAVLFDRDGTLVKDVPYNGDPARVELVDGAREALARLRAAGVPAGVVSNQSGIARGLITEAQVRAVNARVEALLGRPVGPWAWCPHGPEDGCDCRKPAPGLIRRAAAALGVEPADCVVIGDIGADVAAARAAGARAILVPTPVTRAEEVADADEVAPDLVAAVERALGEDGVSAAHVLAVRLDNDGDVLLAGPAIRALAAGAARVTLLHGPRGRRAAALLPGVDATLEWCAPWIDPEPARVDRRDVDALVARIAALHVDTAVIFGSFHQSPLPTALLLRLAGVPFVAATSVDYPGALLDVRHRIDDDVHEVERALALAAAAGLPLPAGDDDALRVLAPPEPPGGAEVDVVVHPGASVPARAWAPERNAALVDALVDAGRDVTVTGGPDETALTGLVAGPPRAGVRDLGGRTTLPELAGVLAAARVVVVGNTGPAHLAAAVGTPVVSLFAPTVPAVRWHPWQVPHRLLFADVPCAGCRARVCSVAGHPCLGGVAVADVLDAVEQLAPAEVAA